MRERFRPLVGILSVFAAALLVYSQTWSLAWDEGYHLVAAQMIDAGKRLYLDFCFPQTPLNAYWNAGWMQLFGETWHIAHGLAALMTSGAVLLAADFVLRRVPLPRWQLACAVTVVVLTGFNSEVFKFGSVGQPYGLCLFLIVAAFRVAVTAADHKRPFLAGVAGFLSGAAAASSLLTAPVAPILFLWLWIYNRAGNRWFKSAALVLGGLLAFVPVLWLFIQAPRLVYFNLVEYQLIYRTVDWPGATEQNIEVFLSPIDSPQALLLGLLALSGLLFIAKTSGWERQRRGEFTLCGWLAAAECLHVSTAHPTFPQYYLLAAPFLAILASVGVYAAGSRLFKPDEPWRLSAVVMVIYFLAVPKLLYDRRDHFHWADLEKVAAKVNEITPPGAPLLAEEQIYFLTRRLPPPGEELGDSHKLGLLPLAFAAALHIVPRADLERQIKAGAFSTIEDCTEEAEHNLALMASNLYTQHAEIATCQIVWDKRSSLSK